MKHAHARYPLLMSIFAFVCFLGIFLLLSTAVQPLWGRIMLLALPALIFGLVAFLAEKGKLGVTATNILTTTLLFVFFGVSLIQVMILFFATATTVTTDTKYYSRAYRTVEDGACVSAVFPKSIPEDAENVSFSYTPQFLQGGEVFELSYTTTPEKLTEWAVFLKGNATWVGTNHEWYSANNRFFYGEEAMRYQLYWNDGNHGEESYVLIDNTRNQITFYYSIW